MKHIKKLINKHINENWNIFLIELQNLRIKNNVKEYFLKLRFYTFINKNTDTSKNMKINDMDKKLINIEINKKYKTLLCDKGHKEYYFNKTDKVTDINAADIKYAIKKVVKNKATRWDLIPGKAIKNSINLTKKKNLIQYIIIYLKYLIDI